MVPGFLIIYLELPVDSWTVDTRGYAASGQHGDKFVK